MTMTSAALLSPKVVLRPFDQWVELAEGWSGSAPGDSCCILLRHLSPVKTAEEEYDERPKLFQRPVGC